MSFGKTGKRFAFFLMWEKDRTAVIKDDLQKPTTL